MVSLYVTNVSELPDPVEDTKVMEELSKERQKRILSCRREQQRLQSFGAGLLLNKILGRQGILPEMVRIDKNGKPEVDGICFNLSHSGDIVICAVSEKPVGCDIEQLKDAPKQVAERSFTEEEKEYLRQFSEEEYNREFFRIWTRKESYLKMTGTGIRVPLNKLEIKDCFIKEYEIPGYQITVCAKENEFADLIWEIM